MKWTKFSLFFAFFAVSLGQVFCLVSPPTNLSVNCHNFENILYWNYSDPIQEPKFSVEIKNYKNDEIYTVNTSQKYLDITNYTDDPGNVYFISVTAIQFVSEHSNSLGSTMFTYSSDFQSQSKCMVDFPEVNVSVFGHTIEISFYHPYVVYDEESLDNEFTYTITCNETECGKNVCDELCKQTVHLPENLYGQCFTLHLQGTANDISLESSIQVCSSIVNPPDTPLLITIILCSAIIMLMLTVAGVIVYKKLTQSDSQRALFSKILGIVSQDPSIVNPEQPTVSQVTSVSHTPLMITVDEDLVTLIQTSPTEVNHLPIPPPTELEFNEDQEAEASEEDDDINFDSFSGYDRKKFPLEMSPGDEVEAYRP
ncbi:interferon gamma receptor 1-like [Hoplias malabaricus]|uniref:interferon gamma receptor 1-like n=1 Tax=Hoplias malabaricus TaxID=27720 RepID=UPI00346351B3